MPDTVPLMLPVPRTLLATKRRVRGDTPEVLAVLDAVPVMVASLSPDEAPVALRTSEGGDVRSFGGHLYRPLFLRWGSEGCTVEEMARVIKARADRLMATDYDKAESFGNLDRYHKNGEQVVDLDAVFRKAKKDRGLRSVDGHQLRDVFDDGRAAQRRMAEATAANLAFIAGQVWHRCPAPFYTVGQVMSQYEGYKTDAHPVVPDTRHAEAGRYSQTEKPEGYYDAPWLRFPPDRKDDIGAFGAALAERGRYPAGSVMRGGARGIDVVDLGAFLAGTPPRSAADTLKSCAAAFLEQDGHDLSEQSNATILAYIEARDAVASLGHGDDPDEAYARIRPYLLLREEWLARRAEELGADEDRHLSRLLAVQAGQDALGALMLRYERFESPRPELYAAIGDEAGLAALAM